MSKTKQEMLQYIDKYIIPQMIEDGFENDAQIIAAYQALILSAKHYSMPDGGRLMEITDFNVPLKNGFVLPGQSITLDYRDDDGTMFLLCVNVGLDDCSKLISNESIIAKIMESGSKSITIIVQFAFYDDTCGVNPVVAILPNNCITENKQLEFIPFTMMRQSADNFDIKQCMSEITADIFTVYEFGLALSCGVDVNKNSKKGFVRNVDGQNVWDDSILNLSFGVN